MSENNVNGITGADVATTTGIIGATVGIGQYIINDYVITLTPIEGDYGYTMTITRGSETQTVTLYGLSTEQYDAMLGYLEQAQAASTAAQTAADAAARSEHYAGNHATRAIGASQAAAASASTAESAATRADTAATSAGNAQTAAETAASNAATAQAAAASAATNAGNAQTAAEAAQSAAETAVEQVTGMNAEAETLEPGSPATASYADGVLSLGIPQGEHGESGVYVGQTEPSDPDVNVWIDPNGEIQPGWKDKTLYCYGDSVTEQGKWQPYLNRICNFGNVINGGHSGYRLMLLATTANIDAITDAFDVMVVMAGINDWTQDRQIGTISDVNTDAQSFTGTFYGGLNQMLSYLTTKWPARRFMFITPTYVYLNDSRKFFGGTGHGDVNSLGLTIRDYADAMIAACKKWNVPCLDLLSMIGWNAINIATFVQDDPSTEGSVTYANYSHPNNDGAKIMASAIAHALDNIAPIA